MTKQIDEMFTGVFQGLSASVEEGHHRGQQGKTAEAWTWHPDALLLYRDVVVPGNLAALASKQFGADGSQIDQLGHALKDVQALAAEYAETPWQHPEKVPGSPEDFSDRDREKSAVSDVALRRLWFAANDCGRLQAHAR